MMSNNNKDGVNFGGFNIRKEDFIQLGAYLIGLAISVAVLRVQIVDLKEHITNLVEDVDAINTKLWDIQSRLSAVEGRTVHAVWCPEDYNFEFVIGEGGYMSTAAVVDFVDEHAMEQGSRFYKAFQWKDNNTNPIPLNGYSEAEMKLRKTPNSPILASFSLTGGEIDFIRTEGKVIIDVPAATTQTLNFLWAFYDLELVPPGGEGQRFKLIRGKIQLIKEMTK